MNASIISNQSYGLGLGNGKTYTSSDGVLKEIRREKERKIKELKIMTSKLGKSLVDAKKGYDEKKRKNQRFAKENQV